MIGPILNMLKDANKNVSVLKNQSTAAFSESSKSVFGTGTKNVTVTTTMTTQSLYEQYQTLEFKDLTINPGVSLLPQPQYDWNFEGKKLFSYPTNFHPLVLKCSGTLTVLGALTTKGCGAQCTGGSHSNYHIYQSVWSPVSLTCFGGNSPVYNYNKNIGTTYNTIPENTTYSFSAQSTDFFRLLEYGRNFGFLNGSGVFLVGGGGSYSYKWKRGTKYRTREIDTYGFASGGKGYRRIWSGCAGGFLALYFRKLIINGKEYGKDPCDISRISANGYFTEYGDARGGGCMVVAADTINIGPAGTINSDSDGGVANITIYNSMGTTYALSRTPDGHNSIRPSFMNNIPALYSGQGGVYYNGISYVGGNGSGQYYFDDGTGYGIPNCHLAYDADNMRCGGAGIALGYKVE